MKQASAGIMPTKAPNKWPGRLAVGMGAAAAFLGLVVLAGWHLHVPLLVQVSPRFAPMQYNTALGFLISGVGLLCWEARRTNLVACLGAGSAILGGVTLGQYLSGANLGIDELFMAHEITTKTSHPGRMSPNTALCFLFSGAALVFLGSAAHRRTFSLAPSLLGAFIGGWGGLTLFGYLGGDGPGMGWTQLTRMAVHTAIGFLLIGTGLFVRGFRFALHRNDQRLPRFAFGAGIVVLIASVSLVRVLQLREVGDARLRTGLLARTVQAQFHGIIADRVNALRRIADRLTVADVVDPEAWERDARNNIADHPGYLRILRLDRNGSVQMWSPAEAGGAPGFMDTSRLPEWKWAAEVFMSETYLEGPEPLLYGTCPVWRDGQLDGALTVEFGAGVLLQQALVNLSENLGMRVFDEDRLIFHTKDTFGSDELAPVMPIELRLRNRLWRAELWLKSPTSQDSTAWLGLLVLLAGTGFAIMLADAIAAEQKIQRTADELQASHVELSHEVTLRREAEAEVRQFNRVLEDRVAERTAELERSNRELDNFAYVASHDLKSPLRAIDNLAKWIVEDCSDRLPEESRDDLNLMRQRVSRMERLLDSLLEYSRIGRREDDPATVNLAELVEDIIAMLDPPAGFRIEIAPDLPRLKAPKGALYRVFGNLISNAIKHHDRQDGRIALEWRKGDGKYEFTLADDGPGIPAEYHDRIFQLFQALKRRDEVESTGIGLALVKKTVELHGGEIRVESEGRGTKFCFSWPAEVS